MFGCCFWRAAVMEEEQPGASAQLESVNPIGQLRHPAPSSGPHFQQPGGAGDASFFIHLSVIRSGLIEAAMHGRMCYHDLLQYFLAPACILIQSTHWYCCKIQASCVVSSYQFDIS